MFNLDIFRRSSLMGTTLHAAPIKSYAFSCQHGLDVCIPILFSPWPPYNLLARLCLTCIFFVDSHWWVQHPQSYAISTNYHVYIAMPTWYTCTPILFWPPLIPAPLTCSNMPHLELRVRDIPVPIGTWLLFRLVLYRRAPYSDQRVRPFVCPSQIIFADG